MTWYLKLAYRGLQITQTVTRRKVVSGKDALGERVVSGYEEKTMTTEGRVFSIGQD